MSETERGGIWWLCSYPKSGNTWLRMFLSAYYNPATFDPNAPAGVMQDDVSPYTFQLVCPFPVDLMSAFDLALLRPAYLAHKLTLAHMSGQTEIFMKTHNINMVLDDIPLFLPRLTKGVVYVVRDPRDVAVSWAHHVGQTIDESIEFMATEKALVQQDGKGPAHILGTWTQHVRSWMQPESKLQRLVIRYEDMTEKPEKTFGQVIEFVGSKVDRMRLAKALDATAFDKLQAYEEKNGFREALKGRRFFRNGKAGAWREVLSPEQASRIERDHGDLMKELGYGC